MEWLDPIGCNPLAECNKARVEVSEERLDDAERIRAELALHFQQSGGRNGDSRTSGDEGILAASVFVHFHERCIVSDAIAKNVEVSECLPR